MALAMLALAGCGGSGGSGSTEATGGADAGTRAETRASTEAPKDNAPNAGVVAESEGEYSNAPPITKKLVREWPRRWCRVRIGDTREQVVIKMGAYPTDQNSHKIPLFPPIHVNAAGEVVDESPPRPYGSDTWEAPGSYQFNSFFNTDQRVQQLDFDGPDSKLPCDAIRVGNG